MPRMSYTFRREYSYPANPGRPRGHRRQVSSPAEMHGLRCPSNLTCDVSDPQAPLAQPLNVHHQPPEMPLRLFPVWRPPRKTQLLDSPSPSYKGRGHRRHYSLPGSVDCGRCGCVSCVSCRMPLRPPRALVRAHPAMPQMIVPRELSCGPLGSASTVVTFIVRILERVLG